MPTAQEHRRKYQDNKELLTTLFDIKISSHRNWIVIMSFYMALHVIEAKLFKAKGIHSHDHKDRDRLIDETGLFSNKVRQKYKQLESYSKIARYEKDDIRLAVAEQMKRFAMEIEAEIFPAILNTGEDSKGENA